MRDVNAAINIRNFELRNQPSVTKHGRYILKRGDYIRCIKLPTGGEDTWGRFFLDDVYMLTTIIRAADINSKFAVYFMQNFKTKKYFKFESIGNDFDKHFKECNRYAKLKKLNGDL